MTIASYAISVSYLGREVRRSKWLIEKRKKKLRKDIEKLHKSIDVDGMKQKITDYTKEEKILSRAWFLLSVEGAVLLPSTCFIAALLFATIGFNLQLEDTRIYYILGITVLMLGSGFSLLLLSLKAVEWAASRVPLPKFEVLFESGLTKEVFHCKEQKRLEFWLKNIGELIAENLRVFVFFPPEFGSLKSTIKQVAISKQSEWGDYPDYNAVIIPHDSIHVDENWLFNVIMMVMPEKKGIYVVPIKIHERNIGVSEHKLTFEIVS